jgi:hypothetical protein
VRTHKKRWSLLGFIALVGSFLAYGVATSPLASADTLQDNGCLGVTGTFSQFSVPITGLGTPNPDVLPGAITLSGTSVQIQVDATLIGAGVTTGLVSPSDNLADIGVDLSALGPPYDNIAPNGAGVNAVTSAVGSVTLKINGSNTSQGTQSASNTAPVALTFYVVRDPVSGVISVYTAISIPPSSTPNPARTGTLLVGGLPVTIPLSNTTWTPTGGNVVFSEVNSQPANLLNPSVADQNAAPLILLPKINGAVSAPFHCWPGTVSSAPPGPNPLIPGPSSAIDTVTVTAPPAAPVCGGLAVTVGGGQSITIDLNPKCTDVNGNWNAAGIGYPPGIPPLVILKPDSTPAIPDPCLSFPCTLNGGTLDVTATPGVYSYTNTDPNVPLEGFAFVATDSTGLSSTVDQATGQGIVLISVLGNHCDATSTSCSLTQVISVTVTGTTMTMDQAGSDVTLGGVTLDGEYKVTSGALQQITVTNARGTAAGWSVTGLVTTDFTNGTYAGGGCATPATYDRNCVPRTNLGWGPTAAIAHTVIPGDVAQVTAGATGDGLHPWTTPVNGGGTGSMLCSSPTDHSGGTFHCNATLWLGIPASAGAGTYSGKLVLTLA